MVYGMEIFRGTGATVPADKDVFEKHSILRWGTDISSPGKK
jgi:hypothetical protein